MRDLTRELSVGTCCGKCVPEARQALAKCLSSRKDGLTTPFFPVAVTEFAV